MEYRQWDQLMMKTSAVGLGTWVMGGFFWGGAQDKDSIEAIEVSIESGINLIDTAPAYGFGRAEEIVGKVIKRMGVREKIIIATKCGLEWDTRTNTIRRNSSRKRILQEIDESRKRLKTDVIDIYQVHWPDEGIPFGETMETMLGLYEKGIIRAIGVSNFDTSQIEACLKVAPVHSLQPPYNLFERGIEDEILPFCKKNNIAVLAYGSLCRGLLTGKFKESSVFDKGDIRSMDPKFEKGNLKRHLAVIEKLIRYAAEKETTVGNLAIRWTSQKPGVTVALVGARTAEQARQNERACDIPLSEKDVAEIEKIVDQFKLETLAPSLTGPPRNKPKMPEGIQAD